MSEEKIRSKTEEFKIALQAKVAEVLGEKVSKQKAWDLYKELTKLPFSFILNNYDAAGAPEIAKGGKIKELELPLAGIGTFKVIPVGKDDNLSVKGRWYLSSALDRAIKERLGFEVAAEGGDEEVTGETGDTANVPDDLDLDL